MQEGQGGEGLLDVGVHALEFKRVGQFRLGDSGKGVGVERRVQLVAVDGHRLGEVERGEVGGGDGRGVLAEVEILVGKASAFRPEHQGDATGADERQDLGHGLARGPVLGPAPTLAGGGADDGVVRFGRLGGGPAAAHGADQMGGLVGRHLEHALLVRLLVADHGQPGDAEIAGHPRRGADVFRVLRPHQDDAGLVESPGRGVRVPHRAGGDVLNDRWTVPVPAASCRPCRWRSNRCRSCA